MENKITINYYTAGKHKLETLWIDLLIYSVFFVKQFKIQMKIIQLFDRKYQVAILLFIFFTNKFHIE